MSAGTNVEATFCFVDIAGYTALTHTHGETAAADLVDEFGDLVRTSVKSTGQLQSLIGDCAFLIFPDPLVATHALSALYQSIADRQDFPIVRSGLHHGSALYRGNNHFGSAVNLAARVAARATGGPLETSISRTRSIGSARLRACPGFRRNPRRMFDGECA
jgi:adenylate cyclase